MHTNWLFLVFLCVAGGEQPLPGQAPAGKLEQAPAKGATIEAITKLEPPTQTPRPETGTTRGTFLFVRTEPTGAEVLVDGQRVGAADDLFPLKPGVRTIVIHLDGHDPEGKKVTIRAGRVTRLEVKLTKEADSQLEQTKSVQLARADTPNAGVVLDLASGRTMTLAECDRAESELLREGDLFYIMGIVGCLRGANAMLWDGQRFVALQTTVGGGPPTKTQDAVDGIPDQAPPVSEHGRKPLYQSEEKEMKPAATGYRLPKPPCRLLITTAENKHFDLTVLSKTDDGGITLEYRPAHSSVVPEELVRNDEAVVRTVMDQNNATMAEPLKEFRSSVAREMSVENLKQIGLACHNYYDTEESFPAWAKFDADGQPLLSWRVHILQYLGHEEAQLYDQFSLNEPWDSEANRKLIERMPGVFRSPGAKLQKKGHTSYLVPVGAETVFSGKEGSTFERIGNTTKTVLAVEVDDAHSVIWTRPADLSFDPQKPLQGLDGPFDRGFHALFCDGHVEFLGLPQDLETLRTLFTVRRATDEGSASNPSPASKAPTGNRGS